MDDEIGLDCLRLSFRRGTNGKPPARLFYRFDLRPSVNLDADVAELLHQPVDKVGIELREHPFSPLQYRHLRPGPRGDVRELGGDVAAAHQDHAARQLLQIEKILVGRQVLFARNSQFDGFGAGGDEEMPSFQSFAFDS